MEFLLFDSFPKKTFIKSTNLLFLCLSLHTESIKVGSMNCVSIRPVF